MNFDVTGYHDISESLALGHCDENIAAPNGTGAGDYHIPYTQCWKKQIIDILR